MYAGGGGGGGGGRKGGGVRAAAAAVPVAAVNGKGGDVGPHGPDEPAALQDTAN